MFDLLLECERWSSLSFVLILADCLEMMDLSSAKVFAALTSFINFFKEEEPISLLVCVNGNCRGFRQLS